jgi:hypothetical protein
MTKPYMNTPLTKFLEKRVLELRPTKSQAEIASEPGFLHPNMILGKEWPRTAAARSRACISHGAGC